MVCSTAVVTALCSSQSDSTGRKCQIPWCQTSSNSKLLPVLTTKKSRIRETQNLLTDADRSPNIFVVVEKRRRKKFNLEQLLVFKALRVGPQMHQSISRTPPTHGPSTGAIWTNSLFLRLYGLVHKCTSPSVEHLPRMDLPWVPSGTTPCF